MSAIKLKQGEGKMKSKVFGSVILACFFICCASPGAKQVKMYQGKLETMIGNKSDEVATTIKNWEFDLLDQWEEENPDADKIKEHKRPVVGFSDSEIQQIFSAKGKYRVMIHSKKMETQEATLGSIDQYGRGNVKDTGLAADRYCLIRTVFKDGVLMNARVWGNVHQTHVSGMKLYRRS
jgi:hypothetical protein